MLSKLMELWISAAFRARRVRTMERRGCLLQLEPAGTTAASEDSQGADPAAAKSSMFLLVAEELSAARPS
jgi:hypothetical protein